MSQQQLLMEHKELEPQNAVASGIKTILLHVLDEYIFGGVTRTLLKDCPVTLVIAH